MCACVFAASWLSEPRQYLLLRRSYAGTFYRASSCISCRNFVCLSVCHTRALWQNQTMHCICFDITRNGNRPSFLTPTVVGRAVSPFVWNLRWSWPTPFEKRRLRQISAYNVSTVRDSDLADELREPADFEARCRLRSTSSSSLVIRRTRLSTVGDRAFPVAVARVWNSLPQHVTSAQSLPVFHSRLKTHLFRRCFPWLCCLCLRSDTVIFGHVNRFIGFLTYYLSI